MMIFKEILETLKNNVLLPSYSAERRIDVLLELFLPDILSKKYERKIDLVSPEFPLKHQDNNQSYKLDFLCMFEETKQPVFVELKTDIRSLEDSFKDSLEEEGQAYRYMRYASDWPDCIEKLREIISSEGMPFDDRKKYLKLLRRMLSSEVIFLKGRTQHDSSIIMKDLDDEAQNCIKTTDKRDMTKHLMKLLCDIKPKCKEKRAKLIYIAPADDYMKEKIKKITKKRETETKVKVEVLDFATIAGYAQEIKHHKEEFNLLFDFLKNIK